MAPKRQGRALVAFVVALDVGLAIAGTVMLVKGLAGPRPGAEVPMTDRTPVTEAESAPTTPSAPSANDTKQNLEPVLADPPPTDAAPPPPSGPTKTPPPNKSRKPSRSGAPAHKSIGSNTTAPDPPAPTASATPPAPRAPLQSLASEIELATSRTRPQFDACYFGAGGANAVRGIITVAFQVTSDGRPAHVTAVVNTTGSVALAACLVSEIARWQFAARPPSAASFTRTFNYG